MLFKIVLAIFSVFFLEIKNKSLKNYFETKKKEK